MDSIHHQHQQSNPNHQDAQNLVDGDGYGYNNVPNDFNNFFNNDPNPAFNASWDAQALVDPQIQTSNYPPGPESWPSNPLNSANTLNPSTYAFPPSRDYGQAYSTNPPAFRYASFDAPPSHAYSNSHFDPRLAPYGHGHDPILTPGYDINRSQAYGGSNLQGQTISPQALQSYPNAYGQYDQEPPYAQNAALRRGQPGNVSQDAYSNVPAEALNANIPKGIPQGNFLIKDMTVLAAATNSRKVAGFVFVGNNPVRSEGLQGTIQKPVKRKSKNEIRQRVLAHQSGREWSDDQRSLLKELNLSRKKPRIGSHGISTPNSAASLSAASDSSSRSDSDSSSEDSDYDSESDDEKEANMESSPLPSVRPEDSVKAVEYDIIKIVWHRSRSNLSGPAIRAALGEYWDLIKGIRDQWKADLKALEEAEEKKDQYRIKQSKRRAAEQRQMLEVAIGATVQHGHPDIIGRLGENEPLFVVFYQLAADRFKESDYSGPMMLNILELMVRCTTIDRALLEKVKLDKVLSKLIKKPDEKIKALAQKILDSVASSSKAKDVPNKPSPVPVNGVSKGTTASSSAARPSESLRKQRDNATPTLPAKKAAAPLSKPGSVVSAKSAAISSRGAQALKEAAAAKAATNNTAINAPAIKVKVNHVVPKTSSFFANLQSASKKPGTSNAAKAAQQNDPKISKPIDSKSLAPSTSTAPPPPPKPTFSFAETMANLTKPKEVEPSVKPAENLPPETEEEKAKRLRKEERRKLRVSFKPDDTLVDIRYFVHDPEEEVGPDDNMIRDVGDIGSEGRILKMHKGMDEMDEDEDFTTNEVTLAPWTSPSLVDFSDIDSAELDRNIVTRGGKVEVKSEERAVQEQRELNTLMAFYASSADIPLTPREPAEPYSGETINFYEFGDASTREDFIKTRQAQFYADRNPQMQSYNPSPAQTAAVPSANITDLLRMLNAQPPVSQPQPSQPAPTPVSGLEAIFAQFAANGNAPQVSQMQTPQLSVLDPSFAATLAAVNGFTPQPQHAQAQMSYVPPPAQTQTPAVDLSTIIATLGQFGNMQQPQQQQQQYNYQNTYQSDNNDRKRGYDYDNPDNHYSDEKRSRGNNGKKSFQYRGVPKVPCKFWQEGKCKKGDDCTFLHVHE